jgi:acyl-CoA thioester hydrolase
MKTSLDLRVYYEDTDFSGRVYHASYLRFFERGRTEWLRTMGFEQRSLSGRAGLVFAVRRLQVAYLIPGLMDDLLQVETYVARLHGAIIEFSQKILRGRDELALATVEVVALKNDRAVRVPREIIARADLF